jgi:alpha-D-ribose 1-methylphosphonate 5-triphosphate synthase subunit PhnH
MSIDLPGFADPVLDAQASFRAVLDAMARPGSIHRVGAALTPPPGLCRSAAAVLLTLIDAETSLAIEDFSAAADWIAFHCGPTPAACADADFILVAALPDLSRLRTGTDECPELSATVILQVPALGAGRSFTLAGPGLAAASRLDAAGLPDDFAARWAANHALYPRGVDLILCAGEQLAALPRSVTVGEG